MSISRCIVRLKDSHDTEHSVVVYAESLYEAVLNLSLSCLDKTRGSSLVSLREPAGFLLRLFRGGD
jgi:hypothetical protein